MGGLSGIGSYGIGSAFGGVIQTPAPAISKTNLLGGSIFMNEAVRAGSHGLLSFIGSGGNIGAAAGGALGSATSSFIGAYNIPGLNTEPGGFMVSATMGGVSSVLSGGNFAEGGAWAGMGYLTNQAMHKKVVSLKKWVKLYEGKTYNQIADEEGRQSYLRGLVKPRLGPTVRYVNIGNGIILDMRHVLVMGMEYGLTIGEFIEVGQIYSDPTSAMNPQDLLSNEIGASFLDYLKQNSVYFQRSENFGKAHDTYFSNHFYNYIKSLR